MRVGIAMAITIIRDTGGRSGVVIVRVMIVMVADLVRVLYFQSQMRASHVGERDGEDQQTLENDSHSVSALPLSCTVRGDCVVTSVHDFKNKPEFEGDFR
jgi:hypothetical protein